MLLVLPDELLLKVALGLLADDLPSALRLRSVCAAAWSRMQQVQGEAEARRLFWDSTTTTVGPRHYTISDDGRSLSLSAQGLACLSVADKPWATSGVLPAGRASFKFYVTGDWVDRSAGLCLGVCDSFSRSAWSLDLSSGKLMRHTGPVVGTFGEALYRRYVSMPQYTSNSWFLAGFPSAPHGDAAQVISEWPPPNAQSGRIVLECKVADGKLSFRVNEGVEVLALTGFPEDVQMRPWASMYHPHSVVRIGFYS